jgi:hypothetical protein
MRAGRLFGSNDGSHFRVLREVVIRHPRLDDVLFDRLETATGLLLGTRDSPDAGRPAAATPSSHRCPGGAYLSCAREALSVRANG